MKFPTHEEMAKRVAETALDDFEYQGKSIREWIKIIAEQEPCEDAMQITVVEYDGTEHQINCKSFEFRTNQVENWIRIDGSKEIHGVATIKAGSEVEK